MTVNRPADLPESPCVLVIFGASGDLTRRKLLPALLGLEREGLLHCDFAVVGFGRSEMTDAAFRRDLVAVHRLDDDLVWRLVKNLDVIRGKALRRIEARGDGGGNGDAAPRPSLKPHPAIEDFLLAIRRA